MRRARRAGELPAAMRHSRSCASVRRRAGNLLRGLRGSRASARSCSARTWTPCPPRAPVDPVLVDGAWENANDGILGADNKAAVAMLLELARRCSVEGSPVDVELLFTDERGGRPARRQAVRRVASCSPSSATCSTTRRRSARSSPPHRRCTASRPSSTASPPTPGCAPRPAARRSSPPPTRPRRCRTAASTRDDGQPRLPPRRRRVHQRRPRARAHARRGPLASIPTRPSRSSPA